MSPQEQVSQKRCATQLGFAMHWLAVEPTVGARNDTDLGQTDKEGVSTTGCHVTHMCMKRIADVRQSVVTKQQQAHASHERTVHALEVSMTSVKELNRSS